MSDRLADVALVHGSGFEIIDNTYYPSTGSRLNADRAAQLLADQSVELILLSGRGPVPDASYGTSEARVMANYLVSEGFPSNRLEVEEDSTSTVGNWANSALMLREMGALSVVGVAAPVSAPRCELIGDFVAPQSDLQLVGYEVSDKKARVKDYARELIAYRLTQKFLDKNDTTDIENLAEAYEQYKFERGLAQLKSYLHRNSAQPDSVT